MYRYLIRVRSWILVYGVIEFGWYADNGFKKDKYFANLFSLFVLCRNFDLNCLVLLGYSEIPIIVFWMVWTIFTLLVLTSYSFGYNAWILLVTYVCLCFYFYNFDIFTDYTRGTTTLQCYRMIQTLFTWFVFSEVSLFGSVFWSCFSCSLSINEIDSLNLIPLGYSSNFKDSVVINIFYLDIVSIIINTFLLFVSGLCVNMVIFSVVMRLYEVTIWYLLVAVYFGLLFLGNQFYEFNLITTTFSINCYCSSFLLLDSVHFTHVFLGVVLLSIALFRILNMLITSTFTLFIYIAGFYWHFVDVIWFILVRFIYLVF